MAQKKSARSGRTHRARSQDARHPSHQPNRNLPKPKRGGMPTREEVLDYIASSPMPLARRDLIRAFKVPPSQRVALKGLLRDIERSGSVERGPKRKLAAITTLPEIGVIEIVDVDFDGEMVARPGRLARRGRGAADCRRAGAENAGAWPRRARRGAFREARRRQLRGAHRPRHRRCAGPRRRHFPRRPRRRPARADRPQGQDRVPHPQTRQRRRGRTARSYWPKRCRAGASVCRKRRCWSGSAISDEPRAFSLIAIATHGIPTAFPTAALKIAEAARPVALGSRTDLRADPAGHHRRRRRARLRRRGLGRARPRA